MTNDEKQMQLAVNHALSEMQIARSRMAMVSGGMGGGDEKRPKAWQEYGFPMAVTNQMLYSMWERNGVAFGAVAKVIGNCWKSPPAVIEGGEEDDDRKETPFDKEVSKLAKSLRMWSVFKEADKRRLACRYCALVLRFADNKSMDQGVEKGVKKLVQILPVWSLNIKVKQYVTDSNNERYGLPAMWTYTEELDNGFKREVDVHPDRVFVLGDYTGDSPGFLTPAYNSLVSLEKVEGGSGESFLKNAARQLSINYDKSIDPVELAKMYGVEPDGFKNALDEAAKKLNMGNDSMMATLGATVTPLVSTVPDPTLTYDVNLQTVASALDIPTKILVGQQQGDRASTEDREYFNARCQSRRNDIGDEVAEFMQFIADRGVIKLPSEITIVWDDLNESTPSAKLDNAKKMADANGAASVPGEEVFTRDEIRAAAGYMAFEQVTPAGE